MDGTVPMARRRWKLERRKRRVGGSSRGWLKGHEEDREDEEEGKG